MMRSKLTVCSSLLYHWIQLHQKSKRSVSFNPKNFQAWTGEFLERSVSIREVETALSQLTQLNLITTKGKTVRIKDESSSSARLMVPPLPKLLVKGRSRKSWIITSLIVMSLLAVWGGAVAIRNHSTSVDSSTEEAIETESNETGLDQSQETPEE